MGEFVCAITRVSLCLCCLLVMAVQGQEKVPGELSEWQIRKNQEDAKWFEKEIEKIRRQAAAHDAFIARFVNEPPQERVRLWCRGMHEFLVGDRMTQLMIARGTDAAPYLAEIVRSGKSCARFSALDLLCDMDRFVPAAQLLLPEPGEHSEPLAAGRKNRFMLVDGRRIGPEAYAVVKWATEQTKDKDLRFHARQYTGLLDQDLRRLSLTEVLRQWREAVVKSKADYGMLSDDGVLHAHLGDILVETAPESLPPLINLLENDPNGYVRLASINLIRWVDKYRMRLRGTELGRRAIEGIRRAIQRGGLKPVYKNRESRKELWKTISSEILYDSDNSLEWRVYGFMVEKLHGVQTTIPGSGINPALKTAGVPQATAEWRRFRAYLTEIDPYFPSWEYTYVGLNQNEVVHPKVRQKIARYFEYWKRFQAEKK